MDPRKIFFRNEKQKMAVELATNTEYIAHIYYFFSVFEQVLNLSFEPMDLEEEIHCKNVSLINNIIMTLLKIYDHPSKKKVIIPLILG